MYVPNVFFPLSSSSLLPSVARRCIPTIVDLDDQVGEILNLTSDDALLAEAENQTLGDLITSVSVDAVLNGSL